MQRVIAEAMAKHRVINGVIHAAGIVRDGMIQIKTREAAESVLDPKVKGASVLYKLLKDLELDWLVLFSSLSSIVRPHGQSDYSAANAFLDEFSHFCNSEAGFRTLTINWPGWREAGILTRLKTLTGLEGRHEATLRHAILTKDGLEAFKRALASNLAQVIVSPRDFEVVLGEEHELPIESSDAASPLSDLTAEREQVMATTRPELPGALAAPIGAMEQALAGMWGDLLGVKQVSIHDDFFELGGHSLLAVRLFSRLEKLTGRRLPLATLFEARTIAALARVIGEGREGQDGGPSGQLGCVVRIRTAGSRPPFFCVHGVGGNVLNYYQLAQYFDPDQPVYALQSRGLSGSRPDTSVEGMAASYIKGILQVQPLGPYFIGGQSFGGLVAYEIACQLEASGRPLGLVALINTRVNYHGDAGFWRSRKADALLLWDRFWGHTRRTLLGPGRVAYWRARAKTLRRKAEAFAVNARLRLSRRDGEDLLANLQDVKLVNYLSRRSYVPRPLRGSVTLFRAASRGLGDHPDYLMGWRHLALGGVHVEETPGDHLTMLMEPQVRVLAEKLCARLRNSMCEGTEPAPVPGGSAEAPAADIRY